MRIDLDRFLLSVVRVENESGGGGRDAGIRHFDCPLCGEDRARGWVGVSGFGAGCFNIGCPAEPTLTGGAVEWARRVLRLATRAEAWRHLEENFGVNELTLSPRAPLRGGDFCRLPQLARRFETTPSASVMQEEFSQFVKRQWGADAVLEGLLWCAGGRYAFRVIIPIVMSGVLVGFQARSVRGAVPKYLTSRCGPASDPESECGRPAAAMLYGVDSVRPGGEVVLVEGAGDVMGWRSGGSSVAAVALLGVSLTPEKLSVLHSLRPSRVVVALDNEPAAALRALAHVEDLRAWGLEAVSGLWLGGKDAGSGARLVVGPEASLGGAVRARLGARQ